MKVFITGSEGFIGSHLTEKLVNRGYDIKAFVMYNFRNSNGWLDDLSKDTRKNIQIIKGDIRDFDVIKRETKKLLKWQPGFVGKQGLRRGLVKIIDWYKKKSILKEVDNKLYVI